MITMDPGRPRAEAMAIKDGRIVCIGGLREVTEQKGPDTATLNLEGGMATPGFVDAHGHVQSLGKSLEEVDLRGAASIDEVIERIRRHNPSGEWVAGRGWDQNLWPGKKMPTHHPLTDTFPDLSVWLVRIDGHAGWANQVLLDRSGVGPSTAAPEGGEILRDEHGEPTGVLVDTAMDLVSSPKPTRVDIKRRILRAQKHLLERGITGAHDMGVSAVENDVYRSLADRDSSDSRLKIRIAGYAVAEWFEQTLAAGVPGPIHPDSVYNLLGVKAFADGALGSRGALMLEPYSDRPGHRGLLVMSEEALTRLGRMAARKGWQIATHAIGDAANRAVLNAYQKVIESTQPNDHRFRVEHCQIMSPEDIPRFKALRVIASMQPTHATSDMPWVEARIGKDRLAGAYAWRSFMDTGARVCFGSDFPVEEADVTFGLHSATTREDPSGQPDGGWLKEQRLTLDETIGRFTVDAAYAARREDHLGVLKEGYVADITCFKDDLYRASPDSLRGAEVLATIVGGEILHRS